MSRVLRVAVAVALALAVTIGVAVAQAPPVRVTIGFPFLAGGKSMPAGTYQIDVKGWDGPIVLRGDAKNSEAILSVMTRLGRHDNDRELELVFDKLGTLVHLSEVWIPGEDGYMLLGSKERHDHVVLGGPRGVK